MVLYCINVSIYHAHTTQYMIHISTHNKANFGTEFVSVGRLEIIHIIAINFEEGQEVLTVQIYTYIAYKLTLETYAV